MLDLTLPLSIYFGPSVEDLAESLSIRFEGDGRKTAAVLNSIGAIMLTTMSFTKKKELVAELIYAVLGREVPL